MPSYDYTDPQGKSFTLDVDEELAPQQVYQRFVDAGIAPKTQPQRETSGYLSQLGSALGLGYRQMKSGLGATFNAATGDVQDTAAAMAEMGALQREQEANLTPEDVALNEAFARNEAEYNASQGLFDSTKALSGYVGSTLAHPGAAFKQVVQSAPNALVGGATELGGYALGGLIGAGAGIETGPGAIATGIAGAMAGGAASNTLLEAGPAIFDILNERTNGAASDMTADQISQVLQQNPDIMSEGLKTGAIRGSVIGAIEGLGMKGAGKLLTIPERAAARAMQKTLVDAGVDVASKQAVDKALLDPALRTAATAAAETAKKQFTSAGNLARFAGGAAIETGSAGAGELGAQLAAGQKVSPTGIFQEMLGEAGMSLPIAGATKAWEARKYLAPQAAQNQLESSIEGVINNADVAPLTAQVLANESTDATPAGSPVPGATETEENLAGLGAATGANVAGVSKAAPIAANEPPPSESLARNAEAVAFEERLRQQEKEAADAEIRLNQIKAQEEAAAAQEAEQRKAAFEQGNIPTTEESSLVAPEDETFAAQRRADLLAGAADAASGKVKAPVSPVVTAMVTPQPQTTSFYPKPKKYDALSQLRSYVNENKLDSLAKELNKNSELRQQWSSILGSKPNTKSIIHQAERLAENTGENAPMSDEAMALAKSNPPFRSVRPSIESPREYVSSRDANTETLGEMTLTEDYGGKFYYFNRLVSKTPNKGGGSKALRDLQDYSDFSQIPILNEVSAYGDKSQDDLIKWYQDRGFVPFQNSKYTLVYWPLEASPEAIAKFQPQTTQTNAPNQRNQPEIVREEPENGTQGRETTETGARNRVQRETTGAEVQKEVITPQGKPTPATEGKVTPGGVATERVEVIPEDYERAKANAKKGGPGWERVEANEKPIEAYRKPDGQLKMYGGHHRLVNAQQKGKKTIPVSIDGEGVVDVPLSAFQVEQYGRPDLKKETTSNKNQREGGQNNEKTSAVTISPQDTERDLTKPEQMTPEEVNNLFNDAKEWANTPDDKIVSKYKKQFNASDAYIEAHPFAPEYWRENQRKVVSGASPLKQHTKVLNSAIADKKTVSAAAVDAYGITLPEGYELNKAKDLYVYNPQTTAAEKQTPVPSRKGTGAAGVVQSETGKGSIPPAVETKETPYKEESRVNFTGSNPQKAEQIIEHLDQLATGSRATAYSAAEEKDVTVITPGATKAEVEKRLNEITKGDDALVKEIASQLGVKPTTKAIAEDIHNEAAKARNNLLQTYQETIQGSPLEAGDKVSWFDEKDRQLYGVIKKITNGIATIARGEKAQEKGLLEVPVGILKLDTQDAVASRRKSLDSIIGKPQEVEMNAVSVGDGRESLAMVHNSGDVPGVLNAFVGTSKDFLSNPENEKNFPELFKLLKTGRVDEGNFAYGRAFVFTDGIGINASDRANAAKLGITPAVAAVRRVLIHESLVHRGIFGLPARLQRRILQWVQQNTTPEQLDSLAKDYPQYSDWRSNENQMLALCEEFLAKKVEKLTAIPKTGPLARLMDILSDIWRWITGNTGEPTIKNLKDVVKLLKAGAQAADQRLVNGGKIKMSQLRAQGFVTPEMDKAYMDAVNAGDMETAQRMVDAAAKAAGYETEAYHGSEEEFNEFENQRTAYGFFFAPDKRTAEYYGPARRFYLKTANMADLTDPADFSKVADEAIWSDKKTRSEEKVKEWLDSAVRDTSGGRFFAAKVLGLTDEQMAEYESFQDILEDLKNEWEQAVEMVEEEYPQALASLDKYAPAFNEEVENARRAHDELEQSWYMDYQDDFVTAAQTLGYDSVYMQDPAGSTGGSPESFVVFDPKQIKSADPVTYDDAGNVIPLSQRFNAASPDIRASRISYANPINAQLATAAERMRAMREREAAPLVPKALERLFDVNAQPTGTANKLFQMGAEQPVAEETPQETAVIDPQAIRNEIRSAYERALVGESSVQVPLQKVFDEAKSAIPSLTERQFGEQLQNLYEDGSAFLVPSADMIAAGEKWGVYDAAGMPASYVGIMPAQESPIIYATPIDRNAIQAQIEESAKAPVNEDSLKGFLLRAIAMHGQPSSVRMARLDPDAPLQVSAQPNGELVIGLGVRQAGEVIRNSRSTQAGFKYLADAVEEEMIHFADLLAMRSKWEAQGRQTDFDHFIHRQSMELTMDLMQTAETLSSSDKESLRKALAANLAAYAGNAKWNNDTLENVLQAYAESPMKMNAELVRSLIQAKRSGEITATGYQRIANMLIQWLQDALDWLKKAYNQARGGGFGNVLAQRIQDTEKQLETLGAPVEIKASVASNDVDTAIHSTRGMKGKVDNIIKELPANSFTGKPLQDAVSQSFAPISSRQFYDDMKPMVIKSIDEMVKRGVDEGDLLQAVLDPIFVEKTFDGWNPSAKAVVQQLFFAEALKRAVNKQDQFLKDKDVAGYNLQQQKIDAWSKDYYSKANEFAAIGNAIQHVMDDPDYQGQLLLTNFASQKVKQEKEVTDSSMKDPVKAAEEIDKAGKDSKDDADEAVSDAAEELSLEDLIRDGEASLSDAEKSLWQRAKEYMIHLGAIAKAEIQAAFTGKASNAISASDLVKHYIAMPKDKRDKEKARFKKELNDVLGKLIGDKTTAKGKKKGDLVEAFEKKRSRESVKDKVFGPDEQKAFKALIRKLNAARPGETTPLTRVSSWKALFEMTPTDQGMMKSRMFDTIKNDPAFDNLTPEEQQKLATLLEKAWDKRREQFLTRELDRIIRTQNMSKKAAKALEQRPAILRKIDSGVFDYEDLAALVGDQYGIKNLTPQEAKRVKEISSELGQDLMPHERTKLQDELQELMVSKNLSLGEMLKAWWISSVLSGTRTAFTIGLSFMTGGFELVGHSMSVLLNPKMSMQDKTAAIGDAIKNWWGSLGREVKAAWMFVLTGDKTIQDPSALMSPQFFDKQFRGNMGRFSFSAAEKMIKSTNPVIRALGWFMTYGGRILSALDSFNYGITKAGSAPLVYSMLNNAYTPGQMSTSKLIREARNEIIQKGFDGAAPNASTLNAWARNLAYSKLEKITSLAENMNQVAKQGNFTLEPTGFGGLIYNALKRTDAFVQQWTEERVNRMRKEMLMGKNTWVDQRLFNVAELVQAGLMQVLPILGLQFAKFATNSLNQTISFIPVVGLGRLKENVEGKAVHDKMIYRNQAIGAFAFAWIYLTLKAIEHEPDDEKRGWGVEGDWSNLTPQEKRQRDATGLKENTIWWRDKNGKRVVLNYVNWPVRPLMAAFGSMSDQIKYAPDQWQKGGVMKRGVTMGWSMAKSVLNTSAVSQFTELFGSNIASRDPVEAFTNKAARVFGGYAGGFVPRFIKDIDRWMQPEINKYEGWEYLGKEIPFYRRAVGHEYLDVFGKPIAPSQAAWSREMVQQPMDPEYRMLGRLNSRGLWLTPAVAENRLIGKGSHKRPMTDEEAQRYVKEVGKGYREMILRYGDRLLSMPKDRAKDFLAAKADDVRDRSVKLASRPQ